MTLKKKLLIALLSTTCVAAGVAGLAACKDDTPKGDPAYTVTAVDQNGNPVEGVVFRIGYYNTSTYTTSYVSGSDGGTLTATTGKNGKATFKGFNPQDGIDYTVQIAEVENARPYPYGYSNETFSVEFDENRHATYEFKYVPSSFADNYSYTLEYARTFDDSNYVDGDDGTMKYVEEGSKTLTMSLKKDVHSYFTFLPYKELGENQETSGDEGSAEVDYNQLWATRAAAGVYTVTFATTANTTVTMYRFNGVGYVAADDEGIPQNKLQTANGKTNSITVELTVSGAYSRATQFFGLYAANDCDVTVSVVRTGDAEEPPEIETQKVEAPENLTKYAAQSGTLTEMTVDGSLAVVPGDDGYYHVATKTGPTLLVNLTKPIARVGTLSIMDVADPNKNEETYAAAHVLSEYDGETLLARYDYSDFLKAYAAKVNGDGVYPVNADLYKFLQLYAGRAMTQAGEYNWLLPCQYYMPADGMEATGSGTQTDPYVLLGTANKIDLTDASGDVYAQFTANTYGVYTFAPSTGCTITIDGTAESFYDSGSLLHVVLGENEKVTFTVSGTGNVTVTAGNATANGVQAVYDDDSNANGLTEEKAISLTLTGYTAYVVDSSVADGVWVRVQPMVSGTIDYTFDIKSPLAQIVYNDKVYKYGETLSLTCTGGNAYKFFLTAKNGSNSVVNGVYAIEWQSVEKEPSTGGDMQLGTTEVTIATEDLYYGVGYTFTSEEGGVYVMTTDNAEALILDETGFDAYIEGTASYIFKLGAGKSFTFYCAGSAASTLTYNVTIDTLKGDASFTDEGGTKHIAINGQTENGEIEFLFLSTAGGTYTISVSESATASVYIASISGDDRTDANPINTVAEKYSYEFTLEANGYISFAAMLPAGQTEGEYDITITKK